MVEGESYEFQREREHRYAEHDGGEPVYKRGDPAVEPRNRRLFKAVIRYSGQYICLIHLLIP